MHLRLHALDGELLPPFRIFGAFVVGCRLCRRFLRKLSSAQGLPSHTSFEIAHLRGVVGNVTVSDTNIELITVTEDSVDGCW